MNPLPELWNKYIEKKAEADANDAAYLAVQERIYEKYEHGWRIRESLTEQELTMLEAEKQQYRNRMEKLASDLLSASYAFMLRLNGTAVVLYFEDESAKKDFMGSLSDGWGEAHVDLKWDYSDGKLFDDTVVFGVEVDNE